MLIHQDVDLYAAIIESGKTLSRRLAANRKTWIQVVRGQLQLDDGELSAGDGVALQEDRVVELKAMTEAEILLFEMVDLA